MADTGDFADSWSGAIGTETQMLNTILLCVQTLQQQTNLVASQNVEIMARMSVLEKHFQLGLAPVEERDVASKLNWNCPLCGLHLQDEASFKGHIRRLVHPSGRPKCHVNCRDEHHDQLVHRFHNGTDDSHYAVSHRFCVAFYGFVRCAISSHYSADDSFALIQTWLNAARSLDDPFPNVEGSSTSSGQHS
jgi:hypothetical protein